MSCEKHVSELKMTPFREQQSLLWSSFYQMGQVKMIVLVKADKMHNILKSLLANDYWSRNCTLNTDVAYRLSIPPVAKKHYIVFTFCLRMR